MRRHKCVALFAALLIMGTTAMTLAQRRGPRGGYYSISLPREDSFNGDFVFCRIAYRQAYDGDGGGWGVDYPRADQNLPIRIGELTRAPVRFIEGEPHHVVVQMTDPALFSCPFVMMSEFGSTFITEEEAVAMKQYLLKGGFLWVDDAWGGYAYEHWVRELRKVLPSGEYPIFEVPMNHSMLHTLFDVQKIPQIPAIGNWYPGRPTSERPWDPTAATATARAIADSKGRVMVFMTHNTDFGDAYEREADDPSYFYAFSVDGYAVGIDVILYAMTH